MTVSKNGYDTLLMVQELGEVEVSTLVERLPEVDVQNAVNSLKRGKLIEAVRSVNRKFTDSRSTRIYAVCVYGITDKGRAAVKKYDDAVARKAAIVPRVLAATKTAPKSKGTKAIQGGPELHQMQNWVIPARDPNVTERKMEIDGREVKVTYGVSHPYPAYVPPADLTRYRPNPIKCIHAL